MLVETLGDDLVLLAIRPNGVIAEPGMLRYGLAGSELVRLAALRRVDIEHGRIVVLEKASTGDVLLDEALASMYRDWQGPTAKEWVADAGREPVRRYLGRLAAAGTIQLKRRNVPERVPFSGWMVVDAGRLAAARARLDAVAYGTGGADMAQAALAGLTAAIGLQRFIYRGFSGSAARGRITRSALSTGSTAAAVVCAVTDATDDAVQASIGAAAQAAISAATQATASATAHAASHAAHGGGHGGGHH
jgi:hypothetical protein